MFQWTIWLIYQAATTVGFFTWYAKKHPVQAEEMFTYWLTLLSDVSRSIWRIARRITDALVSLFL